MTTRTLALAVVLAGMLWPAAVAPVAAQMPDLSQMSGRPLPSGDLPAGTVSVRVVRGALTNNLAGVDVRLDGGGSQPLTAKSDANGRATFTDVTAGSIWRASATVDGERLESQPFRIPAAGGIRMLLVASVGSAPSSTPSDAAGAGAPTGTPSAPGSAAASGSAVPGEVTLGGQSRIIIELAEESVEVYGLYELANITSTPVMPARPIVFETPAGSRNTTVLEGSTPQAKAEVNRVTVAGPFAPGGTPVQIAYRYPYDGDTLRLAQTLPLRLGQTTIIVRKAAGLQVSVANAQGQREVPLEGRTYIVVNGGALAAGAPLEVTLSGLPHRPVWPRYVAMGLALAIVIGGVLIALRAGPDATDDAELRAARTRRATLFDQLVSLERRRTGRLRDEPGLLARRGELLAEIEALDERIAALAPSPVMSKDSRAAEAQQASPEQSSERLGARPVVR